MFFHVFWWFEFQTLLALNVMPSWFGVAGTLGSRALLSAIPSASFCRAHVCHGPSNQQWFYYRLQDGVPPFVYNYALYSSHMLNVWTFSVYTYIHLPFTHSNVAVFDPQGTCIIHKPTDRHQTTQVCLARQLFVCSGSLWICAVESQRNATEMRLDWCHGWYIFREE